MYYTFVMIWCHKYNKAGWLASLCAATMVSTAVYAGDLASAPRADGVRLVCEDESRPGSYRTSRAAIIETPGNRRTEVVVATGHALVDRDGRLRDCVIRAPGSQRSVARAMVAPNGDDWAVLVTDGRFREPVRRWRLPRRSSETLTLTANGAEIEIFPDNPRARGCIVMGDTGNLNGGYGAPRDSVLHDCPGGPGQSGAPVSAEVDGEARLVAIYLGRMQRADDRRYSYGVARPITGDFAEAIHVAIEDDSPYPPRRR